MMFRTGGRALLSALVAGAAGSALPFSTQAQVLNLGAVVDSALATHPSLSGAAARFDAKLAEHYGNRWPDAASFMEQVRHAYEGLVEKMSQSAVKPADLLHLLREACAENALNTAEMAGRIQMLSESRSSSQS